MGLGLKESKEFVDSIPSVLSKSAPIKEAEEIKLKFKDLAVVEFF
jgi:ribosomal protein L7/L12